MADDTDLEFEGEPIELVVDEANAGGRLDAVLAREHDVLSRSRIKDLILAGAVTIDGKPVSEPKYRLKAGETIVLLAPPRKIRSRRARILRSTSSMRMTS